mmetsp:Transcript_2868/g.8107  ORF Transcript_2868/g.8107 Transcript_2868/m.8107 type:complete len:290 (-) Transcript_2868:69-938(-)
MSSPSSSSSSGLRHDMPSVPGRQDVEGLDSGDDNHLANGGRRRSMEHRDRMSILSDKLCVLHSGLDQDRNVRYEHLQGKLRALDDRVGASQDATHKKFVVLKDQIVQFQRELSSEQMLRDSMVIEKEEEIKNIAESLRASLSAEQEERRASERRILQIFEKKTQAVKEEVNDLGNTRVNNEANLRRYLEVDIPKLYENLKEEVDSREAMEQRMLARAMEEVTGLQAAILAEKKAREDSEEAMLRMMEDVVAKMQAEIAAETKERQKMEEMLLGLLHETCTRMQSAYNSL